MRFPSLIMIILIGIAIYGALQIIGGFLLEISK
jgi:hypothetical protein